MKALWKDDGGFSLLEVVVAMLILTIGLLGMAMLQLSAIQGNAYSQKVTEANALIANKIEEYRQMPFNDIESNEEEDVRLHGSDTTLYTRRTTVEDNTPAAGLKTITVEVGWVDDQPRTISFQTVISSVSS